MATKRDDSLRGRLVALPVGGSVAEAVKFNQDKAKRAEIKLAHEQMVATMRGAVQRAVKDTGHDYTMNEGNFRTSVQSGLDPVIVVIATRVK